MIEVAVGHIIDRLIKLIQTREKNKRRMFIDHIEPVFKDFALIHAAYLQDFNALLDQFYRGPRIDREEFGSLIRTKKLELEHLRVKIHALINAKLPHKNEDAEHFFSACVAYFSQVSQQPDGCPYDVYRGHFSHLLNAWLEEEAKNVAGDADYSDSAFHRLHDLIECTIEELREAWSNITQAYAAARMNLL
jgi:hypothetical protein